MQLVKYIICADVGVKNLNLIICNLGVNGERTDCKNVIDIWIKLLGKVNEGC